MRLKRLHAPPARTPWPAVALKLRWCSLGQPKMPRSRRGLGKQCRGARSTANPHPGATTCWAYATRGRGRSGRGHGSKRPASGIGAAWKSRLLNPRLSRSAKLPLARCRQRRCYRIRLQRKWNAIPVGIISGRTILPLPQRFPPNILAGTLREGDRGPRMPFREIPAND